MKKIIICSIFIYCLVFGTALTLNAHSSLELDFYQMFAEHGTVMLLIDAKTGDIEHANRAAANFYGYSIEQLESMNVHEINILPYEETEARRKATIASGKNNFVLQQRLANGEIRTVEVYSCTHNHGDKTLIFATIYDITDKARLDAQNKLITITIITILSFSAFTFGILSLLLAKKSKEVIFLGNHDSLTRVYSRRYFEENIAKIDTPDNLPISVIMADVNGLKITNDVFGHGAGDLLLKKAAEAMTSSCRKDDVIARIGGDEFIILLPQTKPEDAQIVAERISDRFSKEQQIEVIDGSISLGCDTKHQEGEDIRQTIKNAEEKMYAQKTLERKITGSKTTRAIIELYNKDLTEKEHAKKVSEISALIGKALKLPESEIKILETAGLLHDIGNITIEKSLLSKQDLTDEELYQIRQHPVYGYRILNSSEETAEFARYILSHHERWDGGGYPKGLKGDEIPVLSRIIAVAESYVEMMSDVESKQEAILQIRERAGTEYDPRIAKVLIELLESNKL